MSKHWIYVLGERSGADLKIGKTKADTVDERLRGVNASQTTDETYVCLAAVLGDAKDEKALHSAFSGLRVTTKGSRTEYFEAAPELVEYAAWLRSQFFASPDGMDSRDEWPVIDPDAWRPDGNGRRMAKPPPDPSKLVQDYDPLEGPLAGTPWAWFPNPKASFQDYFTPTEIVNAAREGMGGIDLDAASHWAANREHKIERYFHAGHSAFDHDWEGRVWLNPPYGDNVAWWPRAVEMLDSGKVEQLCIISPVWAFTTQVAEPLMARSSAMLLLSPTPKFWGNREAHRTGTNNPHAIVYFGDRHAEVLEAFRPFGIPFRFGAV
jgi:hypothetical protein